MDAPVTLTPEQLAAWQTMSEATDFEPEPTRPVDTPFAPHHEDAACWYCVTDTTGRKVIACRDEEVARFIAESRTIVPSLLAEVHRLRLEVSLLDADLDSMAARETAALRAEVERLTSDLGHVETAAEPDAEVLTVAHRCDCCSTVIETGDSAVMFVDEAGRECWAHYGACPEPDLWCVEWQIHERSLWAPHLGWIRACRPDGSPLNEPYEDALPMARRVAAASGSVRRVRLVRCKEPSRG